MNVMREDTQLHFQTDTKAKKCLTKARYTIVKYVPLPYNHLSCFCELKLYIFIVVIIQLSKPEINLQMAYKGGGTQPLGQNKEI